MKEDGAKMKTSTSSGGRRRAATLSLALCSGSVRVARPFPLQTQTASYSGRLTFDCGRGARRRRTWMTRDDNDGVDPSHDDDKGDTQYTDQYALPRDPGEILTEFDENIWRRKKIDDIEAFLDSLEFPGEEFAEVDFEHIDDDYDLDMLEEFDKETLLEILGLEDDGETITIEEEVMDATSDGLDRISSKLSVAPVKLSNRGIEDLERALARGVVPAEAGVGSGILPGDSNFDPLGFATKDYFQLIQNKILNLVPARKVSDNPDSDDNDEPVEVVERPPALVLRDYREAEIRHGRLAMLAAMLWPLQEIIDRICIPESFGETTVVYGGPTLPFFPLLMTFFMLNLGYLDIFASEIKENEAGNAFLPGECFWDPLKILDGAPPSMKRNMQEREILNGRAAMIAVAAFFFEEAMTHKPIVSLPTNDLLFEPAYQVPYIQAWLDSQFGNIDYASSIIDRG